MLRVVDIRVMYVRARRQESHFSDQRMKAKIGAFLSAGLQAPAANSLPLASSTVGTLRTAIPECVALSSRRRQ